MLIRGCLFFQGNIRKERVSHGGSLEIAATSGVEMPANGNRYVAGLGAGRCKLRNCKEAGGSCTESYLPRRGFLEKVKRALGPERRPLRCPRVRRRGALGVSEGRRGQALRPGRKRASSLLRNCENRRPISLRKKTSGRSAQVLLGGG